MFRQETSSTGFMERSGLQHHGANLLVSPSDFEKYSKHTGCTLLDPASAEIIIRLSPRVIEWGAGDGRVGRKLLMQSLRLGLCIDYRGYDVKPRHPMIQPCATGVLNSAPAESTLLLCAPPVEEEEVPNMMARDAVLEFSGKRVVYIGGSYSKEIDGMRHKVHTTAGPEFRIALKQRFARQSIRRMPRTYTINFCDGEFPTTVADMMEIWER